MSRTVSSPTLPEHNVGNGKCQEWKLKRQPRQQGLDTHPGHFKELRLVYWPMGINQREIQSRFDGFELKKTMDGKRLVKKVENGEEVLRCSN